MAISKVARHRLLCWVPTLYVHMSKCYFIKVTSKHEERLIFDRLLDSIEYSSGCLSFQNPDNPYCTTTLTSLMIYDDSHIHIIFLTIRRCPRNKCYFWLSEDFLNVT